MKRTFSLLFLAGLSAFLAACQLVGQGPDPLQDPASLTRVAEAVEATRAALAVQTQNAPEPVTPTPRLSLDGARLTGSDLNLVLGVWPLTPDQSTVPSSNPLCLQTCLEDLWVTLDGRGTLRVSLYEFPNRDSVVTELREIKAAQQVLGVIELPLPELVELPGETWMQDNGGTGSRFTLHTRQGRVLVVMTFYLPDYGEIQNAEFLAQYAARQIESLAANGW